MYQASGRAKDALIIKGLSLDISGYAFQQSMESPNPHRERARRAQNPFNPTFNASPLRLRGEGVLLGPPNWTSTSLSFDALILDSPILGDYADPAIVSITAGGSFSTTFQLAPPPPSSNSITLISGHILHSSVSISNPCVTVVVQARDAAMTTHSTAPVYVAAANSSSFSALVAGSCRPSPPTGICSVQLCFPLNFFSSMQVNLFLDINYGSAHDNTSSSALNASLPAEQALGYLSAPESLTIFASPFPQLDPRVKFAIGNISIQSVPIPYAGVYVRLPSSFVLLEASFNVTILMSNTIKASHLNVNLKLPHELRVLAVTPVSPFSISYDDTADTLSLNLSSSIGVLPNGSTGTASASIVAIITLAATQVGSFPISGVALNYMFFNASASITNVSVYIIDQNGNVNMSGNLISTVDTPMALFAYTSGLYAALTSGQSLPTSGAYFPLFSLAILDGSPSLANLIFVTLYSSGALQRVKPSASLNISSMEPMVNDSIAPIISCSSNSQLLRLSTNCSQVYFDLKEPFISNFSGGILKISITVTFLNTTTVQSITTELPITILSSQTQLTTDRTTLNPIEGWLDGETSCVSSKYQTAQIQSWTVFKSSDFPPLLFDTTSIIVSSFHSSNDLAVPLLNDTITAVTQSSTIVTASGPLGPLGSPITISAVQVEATMPVRTIVPTLFIAPNSFSCMQHAQSSIPLPGYVAVECTWSSYFTGDGLLATTFDAVFDDSTLSRMPLTTKEGLVLSPSFPPNMSISSELLNISGVIPSSVTFDVGWIDYSCGIDVFTSFPMTITPAGCKSYPHHLPP